MAHGTGKDGSISISAARILGLGAELQHVGKAQRSKAYEAVFSRTFETSDSETEGLVPAPWSWAPLRANAEH